MAQTPSTMLPLGTAMPSFSLRDAVSDRTITSDDVSGTRATLVMFICNHCPFVKHVVREFGRLEADYAPQGVRIVAINSNDLEAYPEDGPTHMKALATELGWNFPFLMDETQEVAKSFKAACTPDFFLFEASGALAYRGQLDDTRPKTGAAPNGADLRAALDALLAGRTPATDQKPSMGCNIKWKAGNVANPA